MSMSNQETASLFDTVPFYEEFLQVAQTPDGKEWAVVRPICNGIGVEFAAQRMKLSEDEQFNCVVINTVGADGCIRQMFCIPLEQVDLWLSGINLNRIKPENKEKLRRYRNECAVVMRTHFNAKKLNTPEMQISAAQVTQMLTGIYNELHSINTKYREQEALCRIGFGREGYNDLQIEMFKAMQATGYSQEVILNLIKQAVGEDSLVDPKKLSLAINFVKTLYGEGLRLVENPEPQ